MEKQFEDLFLHVFLLGPVREVRGTYLHQLRSGIAVFHDLPPVANSADTDNRDRRFEVVERESPLTYLTHPDREHSWTADASQTPIGIDHGLAVILVPEAIGESVGRNHGSHVPGSAE